MGKFDSILLHDANLQDTSGGGWDLAAGVNESHKNIAELAIY